MIAHKEFTASEKTEWLNKKQLYAYDQAKRAKSIVSNAYHRAHPRSYRGPRDGICQCGRPIDHAESYIYLNENGREYHDHKRCNSWACPVCAPKRAASRAFEIEAALLAANKKGYKQLFVTFTVPHKKRHTTSFVIDRLNTCYNNLNYRRPIRRMRTDLAYVGQIKCLDYTLTDNGTHAHLHTVWMFDSDLDIFDLAREVASVLIPVWNDIVMNECNQPISQKHGINIEVIELGDADDPDSAALAKYSAKAISVYTSDSEGKKSVSPFDLLKENASDSDKDRFLDFYKGQKGRRHIVFSRGLKERLEVDDHTFERPEQAVIAQVRPEHICYLSDENNRQEFEKMCNGSIEVALDWLDERTEMQEREALARRGRSCGWGYKTQRWRDAIAEIDDPLCDRPAAIRKHARIHAGWDDYLREQYELSAIAFTERLALTRPSASAQRRRHLAHLERNAKKARRGERPLSGLGELLVSIGYSSNESSYPFDDDLFGLRPRSSCVPSVPPPASSDRRRVVERRVPLHFAGAFVHGFDPFSADFEEFWF